MNRLDRTSCVICYEHEVATEIAKLNSTGWYVMGGRETNRTGEIALNAIYVGHRAKEMQDKHRSV